MIIFKKKILKTNLNYKKETIKQSLIILGILLIATAIIIINKVYFYFLYLPFLILIYLLFLNQKYAKMIEETKFKKQKEFIRLFTYFEIFIYNGLSVYTSLNHLSSFTTSLSKNDLDILIAQIDEDKTIRPFLVFGESFSLLAIEQAMVAIFLMIEQGSNLRRLSQFSLLFEKITLEHYLKEAKKKEQSFGTLSIFPLLSAGLITIMITFGIMMSIGGLLSGG